MAASRRKRSAFAWFGLGLGLWPLLGPAAAHGVDLGLEATTPTGSKPTEFVISVASTETTASIPIVLRHKRGSTVENVRLSGVAAGKELQFDAPGASDGDFVVRGELLVTVTVAGVTAAVDEVGDFFATVNGRPQRLGVVRVVKQEAAAVVVDEASNGAVSFTTDRTEFERDVHVSSTANVSTEVRLLVSPLRHAQAGQAPVAVTVAGVPYQGDRALPLPALDRLAFTLSADLQRSGTWTGTLAIVHGTTRFATQLQVTRERVAPSIVVDEITAVQDTLSILRFLPGKGPDSALDVRIALRETAGQTLELDAPSILPLLRTDGSNKFQVTPERVQLLVQGKEQPTITVPADRRTEFVVRLHGLDVPGSYTGTLRFAESTDPGSDKALSIFVRDSRWTAALLIAAAVIASAILRWYVTVARRKLLAWERLDLRSGELERMVRTTGPHPNERTAVVRSIGARLEALLNRNTSTALTDAQLDEVDRRLQLLDRWLHLWQLAERRGKGNDTEVRSELDKVEVLLLSDVVSAEDGTKGDEALAKVEAALIGTESLTERIAALKQDVERRLTQLPEGDPGRAAFDRWTQQLAEARTANERGRHSDAAALLERVRSDMLDHLVAELESRLKTAPPYGMTEEGWTELKQRVADSLKARATAADASAKAEAYERSACILVAGLAKALQERIESRANAVRQKDADLADALDALVPEVRQVSTQATPGNLPAAMTAYDTVVGAYKALSDRLAGYGMQMGNVPSSPDVPAPDAFVELKAETVVDGYSAGSLSRAPTRLRLMAARAVGEGLATVVMLVIAVVLGLNLFYDTSPAWGGAKDMAAIVLWGLGLHQVTANTAFGGLADLRTRFASTSGGQ